MGFDDFGDGDVDDGLGDPRQVGVLVHVKEVFRLLHLTHLAEVTPTNIP